jgi:hypothetical protein
VALATEVTGKAETRSRASLRQSPCSAVRTRARVRLHRRHHAGAHPRSASSLARWPRPGALRPVGPGGAERQRAGAPARGAGHGKPVSARPRGVTQRRSWRGPSKPIPQPRWRVTLELRLFRWQDVAPGWSTSSRCDAQDSVRSPEKSSNCAELPGDTARRGQALPLVGRGWAADGTAYASSYRFTVADARLRAEADNFSPVRRLARRLHALWLAAGSATRPRATGSSSLPPA